MSESAWLSCPESGIGMSGDNKTGYGCYDFSYSTITPFSNLHDTSFYNDIYDFEKNYNICIVPISKKTAISYSAPKKLVNRILDFFYKSPIRSGYDNTSGNLYLNNVLKIYELLSVYKLRSYKNWNSLISSISLDRKISFFEPNSMCGEYLPDFDCNEKQAKNITSKLVSDADYLFGHMRDASVEERNSIKKYLDSKSEDLGINFFG